MTKLTKKQRHDALLLKIDKEPFMTDEELAQFFNCSIQTIRLDRAELDIPEMRERVKDVAIQNQDVVRALPLDEVIGDIIELELDHIAISILDIKEEHVFHRNNIARGHFLFAQANSLCVALMNDELALTAKSDIKFVKPVKLNDRVITKATLVNKSKQRATINVESTVKSKVVFVGTFVMYYSNEGGL